VRRPRLRGLLASITLHGLAIGLAVVLLRDPAPQALFIDLTQPIERASSDGAASGPAAVSPPPAPPGTRRGSAARDRQRPGARRAPSPQPSAAPAAPSPPSAAASPPSAAAVPSPPSAPAPLPSSAPAASPAPTPPAEPVMTPPADVAAAPLPVPIVPEPPAVSRAPSASTGAAAPRAGESAQGGAGTGSPSGSPPSSGGASSAPTSSPAASGAGIGDAAAGDRRGSTSTALAVPGEGGRGGGEYAAYLALVRRGIQESLRYPVAARRRGLTGSVHVEITVEPSGRIAAVSLVTSSSHALLDEAALEAVRSAPRVPFPPDVAPRALRVRLPVVFELVR
jgi:protein TonB